MLRTAARFKPGGGFIFAVFFHMVFHRRVENSYFSTAYNRGYPGRLDTVL